ncbi:hypothetical protein KC887_03430 [Candidatus Kaiserbacteria bacterium]|nr:hypothetical protein [Candidatus Kaiserbacteria bacterium]
MANPFKDAWGRFIKWLRKAPWWQIYGPIAGFMLLLAYTWPTLWWWYGLAIALLSFWPLLYGVGIKKRGMAGFYFNYITWHLIARWVISVLAGVLVAAALKLLFIGLVAFTPLTFDPMMWWVLAPIMIIVTVMMSQLTVAPEGEAVKLTVPETKKAALLLWRGMASPLGITIYLETGEYPWIGENLGFSVSDAGRPDFTEGKFFNMGNIPFTVWNDAHAEEKTKWRSRIVAPARNNASVETAITYTFRIVNPRRLTDSSDPALDIGERSRQEWRELTSNFVDTDLPKLHSTIPDVFLGKPLLTAFIKNSIEGLKPGSMVQDRSGHVLFELVKDGDEAAAKVKLEQRMRTGCTEKMLDEVTKNDQINIVKVQVTNPVTEVLADNGLELVRVSFADIQFSDQVIKASNEASAQEAERVTQLANARAAKAARKELAPEPGEARDELAMTLGAALDPGNKGHVKVIMTPGGNKVTSGIVAGAAATGDSK